VALLSVNALAACGGYRPPIETTPGRLVAPEAIAGTPLTRQWTNRIMRGPSGPVVVQGGHAYLGGSDRRVVAVELRTGAVRWAVRLAGPVVGGVIHDGRRIYAATDRPGGKVHAFDVSNGNQAWATGTGYVHAPLTLAGNRVIALNRRGQVVALEAATGKIAWRRAVSAARIAVLPLDSERLLVTGYDSLFVLSQADGRVLSRRLAPGDMVAPWVEQGDAIVTTTGDSLVVALDRATLEERWRVKLDAPLIAPPAVRGDTIYAVTRLGSLFRVVGDDAANATRLTDSYWPATGTPTLIGDWVLVGSADGALRAFTTQGAEAWRVRLGRPFELPPVPLEGGDFLAVGGRGDLTRISP
jgi:outer membrane protein assembly factor BamB